MRVLGAIISVFGVALFILEYALHGFSHPFFFGLSLVAFGYGVVIYKMSQRA